MNNNQNIFFNKKILIYGLGKTGLSTFKFLKKRSDVYLFDDFRLNKKKFIDYKKILVTKFDKIILSPGIDINKCKLTKFLKKNSNKISSDLDVFFAFFKNDCITITGTNGKSTTCQLLYEVLSKNKFDVRLAGNIGNPILSVKNVKKKTIFVIEASSYQLEYSKIFRSKYSVILNLSPDHIERHKTIRKYVSAKFRLLNSQLDGHLAFVKNQDLLINNQLKLKKFRSKIIKVDTKKTNKFLKKINNNYFLTEANKENLSFVLEISKKLNLKKDKLIKSVQNFKGLKYRQQIVFKNESLTIINDSKSTSFSSSIGILKINPNILWLLGGIHKKGDKFDLKKKYFKNIRAFIYGKNKKFFNKKLNNKIEYQNSTFLKDAFKKALMIAKKEKSSKHTILFSPSAASFDSFKNFEDRGFYFNQLVKKYLNGIQKINL
ncbi:UDP-N-acetylmuramoyl-L-alanine--D-glutamate ligase [Pelagibacterales bacterium SAG-MED39]|nr:UDP-N-acetylmuramoyl-L-alanine--D-glutamate ligase [Pelagibacterales bacterium SAG-MED39]